MSPLSRWIAFATAPALLTLFAAARAFTDQNAAFEEVAADRSARVVLTDSVVAPVRTAWVPPTAKSLDGFKPVWPADRRAASSAPTAVAKAGAKR